LFERGTDIAKQDDKPVLPVYVLTEVGKAIASILPKADLDAFKRVTAKLESVLPHGTTLTKFRVGPENQVIPLNL
jgi:hypothetical protein